MKRRDVQKVVLCAAISVLIDNRRRRLYKLKQVKRFWRRSIFQDRRLHSEYYHLYLELRENDREFHYRYLRMSNERFDHLLSLVKEKITKKDTRLREAITAEERLVMTLRYLESFSAGNIRMFTCFKRKKQRKEIPGINFTHKVQT